MRDYFEFEVRLRVDQDCIDKIKETGLQIRDYTSWSNNVCFKTYVKGYTKEDAHSNLIDCFYETNLVRNITEVSLNRRLRSEEIDCLY